MTPSARQIPQPYRRQECGSWPSALAVIAWASCTAGGELSEGLCRERADAGRREAGELSQRRDLQRAHRFGLVSAIQM